jgi:hypothetical protein
MNQRQRFIRKIVYACVIAALLLPLSWLSQPETTETKGGLLAQMRHEHQLGQAQLGEIDPASETIKLVTLGMRGVAANILWSKANDYRLKEDWVGLSATLEQIARLQPNFISVWIYQGWNLSYNISVEFDDYRDRYRWVIKGIDFLKEGTKYNRDEPRLLSDIGWTVAQKIGRADEHVQFRRLFREDDDFNGSLPLAQRDNWLVGRDWLVNAEELATRGVAIRGTSPLLFHSKPVMCLIYYAEALEEEGTFGEVAKNAWRNAAEAWSGFSQRDLPTPYNILIRLSQKETLDEKSKQAKAELSGLTPPGVREAIAANKLASLSEGEREAYETAAAQRSKEQQQLMPSVHEKLEINPLEIADRITGDNHAAALKAAEEATQADFLSHAISTERGIINYDYWLLRCQIEPSDDTLAARKLIHDGDRAFSAAQLVKASQLYVDGFKKWRQVLDAYPKLVQEQDLIDELVDSVKFYRSVLHQLDEAFPKPFVLQDVLDSYVVFHGPGAAITEPDPSDKANSSANDPGKK